MTDEPELLPAVDTPPDVWADEHPEPTAEEIDEGNRLGELIDVDDDDATGGVDTARPVTEVRPELEQDDES